jgi:SNF2 family DNA or RNA helicase
MPLRPYQTLGVQFLTGRRGAILGDDVGLGKTIQTLAAIYALEPRCVAIVCSRPLKFNWRDEIEHWLPGAPVHVATGGTVAEQRERLKGIREGLFIVGREAIRPAVNRVREDGSEYTSDSLLPDIARLKPDVLVVDEAHHFRNRKSQQFAGLKKLARVCGRVWMLTATPVHNQAADMWALLHVADRKRFSSYWDFCKRHLDARPDKYGWVMETDPLDPEAFRREIAPYYFRRYTCPFDFSLDSKW